MKKILVCFALITFCVQAKFDAFEFVLPNGLRAVCIKKDSSPIIAFSIWYLCGSQCDALSKSGCAHYLEHMAFLNNSKKFSDMLDDIGAGSNAFTSLKVICFHEIIPKDYIEDIFKYESMRMKQLDISDKLFESERGAILEERNMRTDSDPDECSDEALTSTIFNRRSGGIPIIGWKHEIKSITTQDLERFHAKYFHPNNAIIVIVGDFENDQIQALSKKYFGEIKPSTIPENTQRSFDNSILKEVNYTSSKVNPTASIDYVYSVPFSATDNIRKVAALNLVMSILNLPTSFTNKLLKQILKKLKKVSFTYTMQFTQGIVYVHMLSSSLDDLEDSIDILKYAINKVVKLGISEEDLVSVKKMRLLHTAYEEDDIADIMIKFGFQLTNGLSINHILKRNDIYQSITLQECNEVIKEVFSKSPIAISRILPKGLNCD